MPSRFSASIAGAITRLSSSPIEPCSPACGLRPATASRGRSMPNSAFSPAAARRPARTILTAVKRAHRLGQRQVDGDRHDAQLGAGEHHGDVDAARQLGEDTRCGRDGGSPHPAGSSSGWDWSPCRRSRRPAPSARRARWPPASPARWPGPGWPARDGDAQLHGQHGQRRLEDVQRRRPAGRSRARGTSRPSLPARAARRAGSSRTKKGRVAALAHRPGLEAEFAADTGRLAHRDGERRGGRHGCLTSMVAWRRRSRM